MRPTLFVLELALVTLTGCASIVSSSNYPVTIDSNPPGATVAVKNADGKTIHTGVAPFTLTLDASSGFFSGARYEVEATLAGYDPGHTSIEAGFDGWYIGNILFGGLVGLLIVDPLTGAMWRLDDQVMVDLAPVTAFASEGGSPLEGVMEGGAVPVVRLERVPPELLWHLVPVR